MKLTTEQWAELREAVAADDVERFEKLIRETARIFVANERGHRRACDQVRSGERGERPYFAFDR